MRAAASVSVACALIGCPSPRHPTPPASSVTVEIGRDGAALRGVAGDGALVFAALTFGDGEAQRSTIEARRAPGATRDQVVWHADLAGTAGPLALAGGQLIATLTGVRAAAGLALRGSPGIAVVGLDAATGAMRWSLAIDASEWSVVSAIAATSAGVVVAGSFSGTLRAGAKVVSSGGKSDGFVAKLAPSGAVEWLVRVGGPGADAIQGVAAAGPRLAIAGTFAAGADLLGTPLKAVDDRSPYADGFVAELDPAGAVRWAQSFGGKLDDAVAGVAIDGRGRIAVAAIPREVVHVNDRDLVTQGKADGLVAWWGHDGAPGPVMLVGGSEFDGLTGIVAAGDRVVIGGFFAGAIQIGDRSLTAGGGDDALLIALDGNTIAEVWPITGDGREEIAALSPVPGGFIAGIAHTATATVAGVPLPAPADPASGAGLVVRPMR